MGCLGDFYFIYWEMGQNIKGLTKHGVAKVNKTDDGLFVEVA